MLRIDGKGENATCCPARSLLTYKKRYKHIMCVAPDPISGEHMSTDFVHYMDVSTDLFTWSLINEPLISSSQFSLTHLLVQYKSLLHCTPMLNRMLILRY